MAGIGRPSEGGPGKGGVALGKLGIGGEPGHLALPERDPVFRKLFEILGASHPSGL